MAVIFGNVNLAMLWTPNKANINKGIDEISAAVDSIKLLAISEIACVALGLVAVALLPKIHTRKENKK